MVTPEFSRIFSLEKVKGNQNILHIDATAEECEALAKRFSLVSVKLLKAEYEITKKSHDESYEVLGKIFAEVAQSCVVTLADVPAKLEIPVKITLIEGQEDINHEELDWLYEEADREYYQNNEVDFGEITAQYLSLALDPYPKASQLTEETSSENVVPLNNPFSVLQRLKK